MQTYDLSTQYDSHTSFYGKARVEVEGERKRLISYTTWVAFIDRDANTNELTATVFGTYSNTTLRHIKEFLKQHGFKADDSKQIMADYGATK